VSGVTARHRPEAYTRLESRTMKFNRRIAFNNLLLAIARKVRNYPVKLGSRRWSWSWCFGDWASPVSAGSSSRSPSGC